METTIPISLGEQGSDSRAIVGGKGASLGKLAAAGFPVPAGFTVTTGTYLQFVEGAGLRDTLNELVGQLNYDDAETLEKQTGAIRRLVTETQMPPAMAEAIGSAYASRIGESSPVAVRSSGTAEDMEMASFAGLHDTYLHIIGVDDVLAAVRRCWASMWSARATAYRQKLEIDHMATSIAVVVQKMVDAEIAGVMFTANPLTVRNDELVINASWGLGEGIVSGVVTPDTYRVANNSDAYALPKPQVPWWNPPWLPETYKRAANTYATFMLRDKTIGSKEVQIIRNPETGRGTVSLTVPAEQQRRFTLTDTQAAELAALGARVEEFYGGIPQDIEWALRDGTFYVLQSRDITGVEFTWDEELDKCAWWDREDSPDTLWTTAFVDCYWTGGITPMHYVIRTAQENHNLTRFCVIQGMDDLLERPWSKYHRGTKYWNLDYENETYVRYFPSALREMPASDYNPLELQAEVNGKPWDMEQYLKMQLAQHLVDGQGGGVFKWFDLVYDFISDHAGDALVAPEELRGLSDDELRQELAKFVGWKGEFDGRMWAGYYQYGNGAMFLLRWMIANWYTGDNPDAYIDLISGLPEHSMSGESQGMWELARAIRQSPELAKLLNGTTPAEFFEQLSDSDVGRAFRVQYDAYMDLYGHRGHTDRDFYYPRRCEDPSIDHTVLRSLLAAGDTVSPREVEREMREKRINVTEEVATNIAEGGFFRDEAFRLVQKYVVKFLTLREDERFFADKLALSKKRVCKEAGLRLLERGILEGEDDFYFLAGPDELFGLLDGKKTVTRLTRLKINNRRKAFHRYNAGERFPKYMRDHVPVTFPSMEEAADGSSLVGKGLSRGRVTGVARVVSTLTEIGRVEKGDIVVCNATDPGWASVFLLARGLVVQTGGMLAHAACLSREYKLPCVQLSGAMNLIADGQTITVDGDAGEIAVHQDTVEGAHQERVMVQ